MVLVSVFGNDVCAYYEKLLYGESGISLIDQFDESKFPTRFGGQIHGFSSKLGMAIKDLDRELDPVDDTSVLPSAFDQHRLDDCLNYCIAVGKKALKSANLCGDKLKKIDKVKAGVLVGTGIVTGG
ncbi:unnamed protein product [Brassica oleracea var. botrytis]